jgi:hypothetical protein
VTGQMRNKLRTPEGKTVYMVRKAVVGPVFGQIKEAQGFRPFQLRGPGSIHPEGQMICATHNLLDCIAPQGVPRTYERPAPTSEARLPGTLVRVRGPNSDSWRRTVHKK